MEAVHPARSYDPAAKALHWLTALAVAAMLALGWWMTGLPYSPRKLQLYAWHKWLGMTVLALTLLRLAWRAARPPPPLPPSLPRWQRLAARLVQAGLLALLLALPMVGWTMSSASRVPVVLFGVWQLPDLVAPDRALARSLIALHGALAWTLAALLTLHVGAALKHHLLDRDDVLRRMLPFARPPAP